MPATVREFEPQLRRLVADHLGVDAHALAADVLLRDDLAADSLDLCELALLVEREFDVAVDDRVFDGVASYGDLVDATASMLIERGDCPMPSDRGPQFSAHLQFPAERSAGVLSCAGELTPYTVETLVEDAYLAGAGARLDIVLPRETREHDLERVSGRFAHLAARGVRVKVRRSEVVVPVSTTA